jgi:hypothetical protein
MRKPVMAFFVFFDITCLALTHFVRAQPQEKNPRFACVSNFFTLRDFEKQPTVVSPDREKSVQLTRDYMFRVVSSSAVVTDINLPDISSDIEVGWSPDSTQFFISYSNGGETGGYVVHMYRLNRSALDRNRRACCCGKALSSEELVRIAREQFILSGLDARFKSRFFRRGGLPG